MSRPAPIAAIEAAQWAKNSPLPTVLRNHLLESNGGTIEIEGNEWTIYPVLDTSDSKSLSRTINNIGAETQSALKNPGFPENAVAIGENGFGDLLVFRLGSETLEEWDHETGSTRALTIV